MKKLIAIAVIGALAYKGYCNYQSYPKFQPRTITLQTEELEEQDIFYAWNPCGRDRPVFSPLEVKHGGNRNGPKYVDMEITKKYLQWGMWCGRNVIVNADTATRANIRISQEDCAQNATNGCMTILDVTCQKMNYIVISTLYFTTLSREIMHDWTGINSCMCGIYVCISCPCSANIYK